MKKRFAIILVSAVLSVSFILSGCFVMPSNTNNAEAAINGFFETLKTSDDINELNKYSEHSFGDVNNVAGKYVYQHLNYRILSSREVDENQVIVTTEITALDMADLYKKMVDYGDVKYEKKSYDEYLRIMREVIDRGDVNKRTQTVDIKVNNRGGTWKVDATDSKLINAIIGQQND